MEESGEGVSKDKDKQTPRLITELKRHFIQWDGTIKISSVVNVNACGYYMINNETEHLIERGYIKRKRRPKGSMSGGIRCKVTTLFLTDKGRAFLEKHVPNTVSKRNHSKTSR